VPEDRFREWLQRPGDSHAAAVRRGEVPHGIRLTVTAEHIGTLADSVEFLSSEFHPSSIQIEPVYLLGRGAKAASAESDEFIEAYRAAAERATAHGRQVHFSGARAGRC